MAQKKITTKTTITITTITTTTTNLQDDELLYVPDNFVGANK